MVFAYNIMKWFLGSMFSSYFGHIISFLIKTGTWTEMCKYYIFMPILID